MAVYYNSSLWDKSKGIPGRPQKINWEFENNGLRRIIPTIYHFSKGIVFDLITIVDEGEFNNFYNKYVDIEEKLSPMEQRLLKQEHPYQEVEIKDIWLNGKKIENGYSSSGLFYNPQEEQSELDIIKKTYSYILEGVTCFNCSRFQVPYPSTNFIREKILRFLHLHKIESIEINTLPIRKFYPIAIGFEMSEMDNIKETSFVHPKTKVKHKLYFQKPEICEIHDLYFMQSKYEIEPELGEGNNLQFDTSIVMPRADVNLASSIGIIGGTSGPTAIFIGGKDKNISYGQKGLPLHNALSIPSLERDDVFKFTLEGINIRISEGEEYQWKLY